MQIIILHRRYAIKQNESVGFVKSKTYAFIALAKRFWGTHLQSLIALVGQVLILKF